MRLLAYVVTGSANPDYPQQKRQKFADAISLAGKLNNLGLNPLTATGQSTVQCGLDLQCAAPASSNSLNALTKQ
ncbi:MAG: hypothetical protein U0Y68_20845 [Blastocatellia bacterium]